jgi:hypothetical protein
MVFGATRPPAHGGYLPTENSATGTSDRYCMHRTDCTFYKRSIRSGNTVDFETDTLEELETHLEGLEPLPGGVCRCGACLR